MVKQPVSVLVVIYTSKLEVLLLERADHPGYWQSVTGSIEIGESLAQTAAREVLEETGIDVTQHQLTDCKTQNIYEIYPHWRHRYAPGITHNTEHVFALRLADRVTVRLSPREHLNYAWRSWQDSLEQVFSPSNKEAIMRVVAIANSSSNTKVSQGSFNE
ncbi:MAG: dihydroneopterin triphosphate diphosphatase [Gallionella sp.]